MRYETEVVSVSMVAENVLRALAMFRYLTVKQMITLGVGKDKGHLHTVLNGLLSIKRKTGTTERRPKEVGELDFGVKVGKGRLARLYYLTKRGAALLEQIDHQLAPVPYPPRVTKFSSDYEHRVSCVDFQIMLLQWCQTHDQQLTWSKWYFHWSNASEHARQQPVTHIKTKGRNIVPDGLFRLRDSDGTERLYAFEMANGRDTGRVLDQIENYCQAIEDDAINMACQYDHAVRVIFVFQHQRHLELVCERANRSSRLHSFSPYFFLKAQGKLSATNLHSGWRRLSDRNAADNFY